MEHQFWHERWALGEIGFHRSTVHWALLTHWATLGLPAQSAVLVPLCGKSLDMGWLHAKGHSVTGIELDGSAVRAFFDEWAEASEGVEIDTRPDGLVDHRFGRLNLIQGDFMKVRLEPPLAAFYDRAALIALPPHMRQAYLAHLASLLSVRASGLLVTYEYVQNQMTGPPFSIAYEELTEQTFFAVERLESRDVLSAHPGMRAKGLTALTESVYRLTRQ